jgi:hypothetical protein
LRRARRRPAADIIVRNDGADIHSGPLFMRVAALADPVTGEGVLHVTIDDPRGESRLSLVRR